VNTKTDSTNCGGCGKKCQSGFTCAAGVCKADTTAKKTTCTAPKKLCSGACVNVNNDASNCGACGKKCPAGSKCTQGACKSPKAATSGGDPAAAPPAPTPATDDTSTSEPTDDNSTPATDDDKRAALVSAAMTLYEQRAHEHYSEASNRWSGITGHVLPPNAPTYSDCSAAVTWVYWTEFGAGPDFLNDQNWQGGNTASLSAHGKVVSCSKMGNGDLAFYGNPISHVAINIGGGRVVSHGSDPVGLYPLNYRSDLNQCRTYL